MFQATEQTQCGMSGCPSNVLTMAPRGVRGLGDPIASASAALGVSPTAIALGLAGAIFLIGFAIRPKVERGARNVHNRVKSGATHQVDAWKTFLLMGATGLVGYGVGRMMK